MMMIGSSVLSFSPCSSISSIISPKEVFVGVRLAAPFQVLMVAFSSFKS
ncbi:hypothetical protein SLEP1_g47926 [Rubroshorea leprosula]|uniref:Uncharacterized protein n=1 Tax=Rubroshorea leprosula TaxID=152421 RepID=A0AAV5LT22_9ROSI|nr:hypothetical protein SLEP1_g47926 [Rubroshorea leprosula]